MIIEKNQKCLVIRVSNFKRYNFIDEHKELVERDGFTWMLKCGKRIPEKALSEIQRSGGHLIVKTPKKQDEAYYYAHLCNFSNDEPPSRLSYPKYYEEIVQENEENSLSGTWLKIDSLEVIGSQLIDHFRLVSNSHQLRDVVQATRTPFLYVISDEHLSIPLEKCRSEEKNG